MLTFVNTHSTEPLRLDDRQRIHAELIKQKVIIEERKLVKLTHVCDLIIDEASYSVVNLVEHIPGAQVPRGAPRILVLDSTLQLARQISYDGSARLLFCKDNQLFLHGFLAIDELGIEGNVITFSEYGQKAVASLIEANDLPKQVLLQ